MLLLAVKLKDRTTRLVQEVERKLRRRNPPVTGGQHLPLPGESTPLDLVELAKRHADAKLICGHTGGDWPLGVRAIRAAKTLVTEISGSDPTTGMVEMAVRELGAERAFTQTGRVFDQKRQ